MRLRLVALAAAVGLPPSAIEPAVEAVLDLTGDAFVRPLSDPAYQANMLCPGGVPIEVSWAEGDPATLRVDLAPLDPAASPMARAALTLALARVAPADVAPWQQLVAAKAFGGFLGLGLESGADRLRVRRKAYLELDHAAPLASVPAQLRQPVMDLAAVVPGLEAHLVALEGGPAGRAARIYFECRNGLALLGLGDWLGRYGFAQVSPSLLEAIRRLAGGAVVLPGAVLLALRCAADETELKIEVAGSALADDAVEVMQQLLLDRPRARLQFERFIGGLRAPALTVASARVRSGLPYPTFNAYAELVDRRVLTETMR